MRIIAANLTAAQKRLYAKPTWACVIGTTTLTSYLIGYDYGEALDRSQSIALTFNNASKYFNSNAPAIGSVVELKRGIGSDLAELPRFWVEDISYTYAGGRALCVIRCIDWWGKLEATTRSSTLGPTATHTETRLGTILTLAGLTRMTGDMTHVDINFTIRDTETLATSLRRLQEKMPERLFAGLDAEIKWKTIPTDEASVYTFGWNDTNHRLMRVSGGAAAWEYNDVWVYNNDATYQGEASSAAQIALVGERYRIRWDNTLSSDADCLTAAQLILDQAAAEATHATFTCRPCHGLELLDVVKIDNPPWGGSDITGRVIQWRESRSARQWQQTVTLGA
jgi:hypothetical protein